MATGDKFEREYISNSLSIFVASIKHDQICVCKRCTGYYFFYFFWLCKSPPGPLHSLKKCLIKNMISLKRYHKVNITLTYDIIFKRQTLHNRKNIYSKHYLKIRDLQVNVGEEVDLKRLILPSRWLTANCKSACIFLTVPLHVCHQSISATCYAWKWWFIVHFDGGFLKK